MSRKLLERRRTAVMAEAHAWPPPVVCRYPVAPDGRPDSGCRA